MGNKKARELTKIQEREKEWERVRSEPRAATTDVSAFGIGARRLQLIVLPSFAPAAAWEIRQLDRTWFLNRSKVVSQSPVVTLLGYDAISADSQILEGYFERAISVSLPLAPRLDPMAGADGTVTQLAVFGSLSSEWRFQWWSDPPIQWKPLTDLATDMAKTFGALA